VILVITLQTKFNEKQEKIAEFFADITNSIISKDEKGNLYIISKSEINEKIAKKLEMKDYLGAGELIDNAKKLLKEPVHEVAEVVSKSIRLPFPTDLKLKEIAQKKNMSLADTIRITSILTMKNKLNEFKDNPAVDQEKLSFMYNLLGEWLAKKSTSVYKEYSPEFRYSSGMSDSFDKFIKFSIYDMCKNDFPKDLMKEYLNENLDFISLNLPPAEWEQIDPVAVLVFDTQSNLFELHISIQNVIHLNKYNEFKESIDHKLHKQFDEIFDFEHSSYYDKDNDFLLPSIFTDVENISGTLRIENNKLFFDVIDVKQKDALNALIYEKITNEKFTDFTVIECTKQAQNALARNDYDTAAQLNERLARFQVTSKISIWYGDIIASIAEESNVVTFTIPKRLLLLWEATRGERSIQEFVEKNLQEV